MIIIVADVVTGRGVYFVVVFGTVVGIFPVTSYTLSIGAQHNLFAYNCMSNNIASRLACRFCCDYQDDGSHRVFAQGL